MVAPETRPQPGRLRLRTKSSMDRYSASFLVGLGLLVSPVPVQAETVPLDSPRWTAQAQVAEVAGSGPEAVLTLGNGSVSLEGLVLEDAVVEFDISFGPQRGFVGLAFRTVGDGHYEHVYLRPHQSGQPDANQYTPVYHGVSAWQLYHGPGYAIPVEYRYDEWIPIRVVFVGSRAEVTIGAEPAAVVTIQKLGRPPTAGGLALTSNLTQARFRRVRWRAIESWPWSEIAVENPRAVPPAGLVSGLEVSSPLPEALIDGKVRLAASLVQSLSWREVEAEPSGLVNLAMYADRGADRKNDTVLVRHRVAFDRPVTALWTFGFSDRVRVYCDGGLVFEGHDDYRSRDYRYLGTIGWFDRVACPLPPGEHEIYFAVSESFGGWGFQLAETIEPVP